MRRIKRRFDRKAELRRAAQRLQAGDLDAAKATCERILERFDDDADARELRAAVALEQGRFADALDDLDRAMAHEATAIRHRGRAGALAGLRRFDEAEEALEHALAQNAGDPAIYELWATVRRGRGDLEGALDACEGALTLDERRMEARRMRAALLAELGRDDEAIEAYRDAVRAVGGSRAQRASILDELAALLTERGEDEEAEDARKLAAALR